MVVVWWWCGGGNLKKGLGRYHESVCGWSLFQRCVEGNQLQWCGGAITILLLLLLLLLLILLLLLLLLLLLIICYSTMVWLRAISISGGETMAYTAGGY